MGISGTCPDRVCRTTDFSGAKALFHGISAMIESTFPFSVWFVDVISLSPELCFRNSVSTSLDYVRELIAATTEQTDNRLTQDRYNKGANSSGPYISKE